MNKDNWKTVVRKTKWASGKRRLGKKALGELMSNAIALEKFIGANKSDYAGADRKENFPHRFPVKTRRSGQTPWNR